MAWEYVLGGIGVLSILSGAGAICYYLSKVNGNLVAVSSKLASLHDNKDAKQGGTVLLPVTRMDPKAECNTVLPLPMGAEMCAHKMEVVTEKVIHAPHEERVVIVLQCIKCGAVDKTIAVTSEPPKPPPPPPRPPEPRSECRHDWEKEKTVTLNSAFEQMEDFLKLNGKSKKPASTPAVSRYGSNSKKTGSEEPPPESVFFDPANAPAWMFQKKCIKERVCKKCGEIDRVVTSNFEIEQSEETEKPE